MKRLLVWSTSILIVLGAIIVLAFQVSPWPSLLLVGMLEDDGASREAALAKHVPASVETRRNLPYGEERDAVLDIHYPAGTRRSLPAVVWVHGGSWIGGSKGGVVGSYLRILASHGYAAVGVEYSTGFGATYPKPVRQVNDALGYLVHNASDLNIDPDAIVLAGDFAGAQIAAQVAVIAADPAYAKQVDIIPALPVARLRGIVLVSGAFDPGAIDIWSLKQAVWAYTGVREFAEDEQLKLLSVTNYVTAAFPRTFISSGNGDPLAPQAVALAEKLEGLGIEVDSLFFPADRSPALPHEYQFDLDYPAGQVALRRTLAFLEEVLAR